MSATEAARRMILRDMDNAAIRAALCAYMSGNSANAVISKARITLRRPVSMARSYSPLLDAGTKRIFEDEARAREVSPYWLMSKALRVIAADNLFEAVIGDELPGKKEGR